MKKRVALFSMLISSVLLFSKPKSSEPEWFQNYRNVYPNKEYIAQRGSGTTAEDAKTDALAALARYFQSNVSANLSTSLMSITANDSVNEQTVVVDEVSVQSQVDFFGVEYTESYFYKPEKKWYCVVYINREDAWTQFKPQIDISRNTFDSLYKNLNKETDDFTKLGMCKRCWDAGKELLQKLEYGRIINPNKESDYENERENISQLPVIFEEAKSNSTMYISADTDYNRTITMALSSALSDSGFSVEKNLSESKYVAKIQIENNISGSDPLSIKPGINIKIVNQNNKTVFSYEVLAEEKSVGYTLESAQKKAYPKLAAVIKEAILEKFNDFLKL